MVNELTSANFISESTLFIRDILRTNITDPLLRTGSGISFIYSSYPKKEVKYPLITVKPTDTSDIRRLGMQSEQVAMTMPYEIRVWARNEKEKDTLAQEIYTFLQGNQFGAGSVTSAVGLHDFNCTSMTNVDEEGEEGIKSKIMMYKYLYIKT